MATHNDFGKEGEQVAIDYLRKLGYEIIETNWRSKNLELDIIAKLGGDLVIFEVKSRTDDFEMEELISKSKEERLIRAVNIFLSEYPDEVDCRIDLITIRRKKDNTFAINHLEGAIDLS